MTIGWAIWIFSALFFLAILIIEFKRSRSQDKLNIIRWILVTLIFLSAIVCAIIVVLPDGIETMSEGRTELSWRIIGILYLATVAGIIAQYFFFLQESGKFNLALFIKPLLISPLVFVPVVQFYQNYNLSQNEVLEASELMILLIAFQNGFFWKTLLDKFETSS